MRRAWGICYSLAFYPLLAVYTVSAVVGMTLWMLIGAPFHSHRGNMRRFRRAIIWYGAGVVRIVARPVLKTVYESPPRDVRIPKFFVANHVSSLDAFLLALVPEEGVEVVKAWPFRLPILGVFARLAGFLNVERMAPEEFRAAVEDLLGEGYSIVVFPEGTRSGSRQVGPFHGTMFRLALELRVPLVPVCIVGNERTPAKGSWILEPATVRMRCLPEMAWNEFSHMTPYQLKNHVRRLIQDEVDRMGATA